MKLSFLLVVVSVVVLSWVTGERVRGWSAGPDSCFAASSTYGNCASLSYGDVRRWIGTEVLHTLSLFPTRAMDFVPRTQDSVLYAMRRNMGNVYLARVNISGPSTSSWVEVAFITNETASPLLEDQ